MGVLGKFFGRDACLSQARQPGLKRPFVVPARLAEIAPQQPVARAAVCSVGDDVLLNAPQQRQSGAAQDLLCTGHDAIAIMRAGGWKSTNVRARYLEMADYNVWA